MTRIWNPYVFTPLGNPIVGEAPPTLRVMGGMQATAQQLSYAQQRFTQFVMQARLSTVPNPTEAGSLPDGTRYRIVKVGPQTTMEIWPGQNDGDLGDSGVLVHDAGDVGADSWFLQPRGKYAQPNGQWKVSQARRARGSSSWHAQTGKEYYVWMELDRFARGGAHVVTAFPTGSPALMSSGLHKVTINGAARFARLFTDNDNWRVFLAHGPAVATTQGPFPKLAPLPAELSVVTDASRFFLRAELHPSGRQALVTSLQRDDTPPLGDFRMRGFPMHWISPHGAIADTLGTYGRFIVAHYGPETVPVAALPPAEVREYSLDGTAWLHSGTPFTVAQSSSTPPDAEWRRYPDMTVGYRGDGYSWSLPQKPVLEVLAPSGACSYPSSTGIVPAYRLEGPVHYIERVRCDSGDAVSPQRGVVRPGAGYALSGARYLVANRFKFEARTDVRGHVSEIAEGTYHCRGIDEVWDGPWQTRTTQNWTTDAEIEVLFEHDIRLRTGDFQLRFFRKVETINGTGNQTRDDWAAMYGNSSFEVDAETKTQAKERWLFVYDPQFELLAYLEVEFSYTRSVSTFAQFQWEFPSSEHELVDGTPGDVAPPPPLPQAHFVVRHSGREVFRQAVAYDNDAAAAMGMVCGSVFPMARITDSSSGLSVLDTDQASTVPITQHAATMALSAIDFGHTRDASAGASGVTDNQSFTRRAIAVPDGVLAGGFELAAYDTHYAKDPRTGGAVLVVKRASGGFAFAFAVDDTGARPLSAIAPAISLAGINSVAQT